MKKEDLKKFIPKKSGYISRKIGGKTDIEILKGFYSVKYPVLIKGETGTGKTHCAEETAAELGIPYRRLNLNGAMTPEQLLGNFIPDESSENGLKLRWQDGILTTFVRYGGMIVLDELNFCPAEILGALNGLLDTGRILFLPNGEIIDAHKDFWCIATINEGYEGTKPLNQALKDRFEELEFDYDDKIENKLISDKKIVDMAYRIRRNRNDYETSVSTRALIAYEQNIQLFGRKVAKIMFLNKFNQEHRGAIQEAMDTIESSTT